MGNKIGQLPPRIVEIERFEPGSLVFDPEHYGQSFKPLYPPLEEKRFLFINTHKLGPNSDKATATLGDPHMDLDGDGVVSQDYQTENGTDTVPTDNILVMDEPSFIIKNNKPILGRMFTVEFDTSFSSKNHQRIKGLSYPYAISGPYEKMISGVKVYDYDGDGNLDIVCQVSPSVKFNSGKNEKGKPTTATAGELGAIIVFSGEPMPFASAGPASPPPGEHGVSKDDPPQSK